MTQASAIHTSSTTPPKADATMPHLAAKATLRFAVMLPVIAAILFLPAGTVRWWQGWALLAVYVIAGLAAFLYFLKTDPQLVGRRLPAKEQVHQQKQIIRLGYLLFAALPTLPGFDFRFGWSRHWLGAEPTWLEVFSLAMVPLAVLAVAWVLWTNRYAGRTIRVEKGQPVISSGPYRLVRHPMYAFSLLMFIFVPLALGSYSTLPAFALTLLFYVPRILNEEKTLRAELPGYTAYCEKTRWRMMPGMW